MTLPEVHGLTPPMFPGCLPWERGYMVRWRDSLSPSCNLHYRVWPVLTWSPATTGWNKWQPHGEG